MSLAALAALPAPSIGAAIALARNNAASLGRELPLSSLAPFVLILLSIALLPLFAPQWWEHNKNRALVSGALALPFALYLVALHGAEGRHALLGAVLDYVSFVSLIGSLYVIAGGIHVKGSLAGTPLSNTALLAIGALLANFIGTTGASMVLIRPLLRANKSRVNKAHIVVFFIFIVSNCGGLLTPLGDPPLFLGFLKGVPFLWTLGLWKPWLVVNALLLVVFHFFDAYHLDREEKLLPGSQLEEALRHEPLRIEGWHNVLLLCAMVLAILGKGQGWGNDGNHWAFGVQEGLMLLLAFAGWYLTKPGTHAANRFRFAPLVEVAVLFFGIFVTMVAPLEILNARGVELGLHSPWQYYWASGSLSSFLDNAPTYLTFAAAACGQAGVSVDGPHYLAEFLAKAPGDATLLAAIACGSVMMGANTYIGNGPNFMVKAIAEESGVKMPSFFGYMLWSGVILLPIFVVITLLFWL